MKWQPLFRLQAEEWTPGDERSGAGGPASEELGRVQGSPPLKR